MTSLHIQLEARSAVHRCWRAYEIDVGADLFGVWLVEMSYGRIGTMGRSKIRSFATAADAQAQVHACLCKRAVRRDGSEAGSVAICQLRVQGLVRGRSQRSPSCI